MAKNNEQPHLLRQAIERLGIQAVATRLDATPAIVEQWMAGQAAMPDRALIGLVNLLGALSSHPRPPVQASPPAEPS